MDDQKKVLINVPRADFPNFTAPNEVFEITTQTEPSRQEPLTIFKVVFDKGYKWQFYNATGRKISAVMNDEQFMERINKGERFAKGDTLVVEMEVDKVLDKNLNIFVEKDFKINKVLRHTPRPKQQFIEDKLNDLPNT